MHIQLAQLAVSLLPEALALLKKLGNKKANLTTADIEQLFEKQFEFNQKTSAAIEQLSRENDKLKRWLIFTTILALISIVVVFLGYFISVKGI